MLPDMHLGAAYDVWYAGAMFTTIQWLGRYLQNIIDLEGLENKLNGAGFPVEKVQKPLDALKCLRVAEIIAIDKHPKRSDLGLLTVKYYVDDKEQTSQVLCGDISLKIGERAILILLGEVVPATGKKLKPRDIDGITSSGMLCSACELGLKGHDGVLVVDAQLADPVPEVLFPGGAILDVEITYNRGDLLSAHGLARELSGLDCGNFVEDYDLKIPDMSREKVEIKTNTCNFFSLSFYPWQDVKKSVKELQLLSQISDVKNLLPVDLSNFILFDLGQPTHIFDADKLQGKVIIRESKLNEEFEDLTGRKYNLPAGLMIIADDVGVISVAGVIGGMRTAYNAQTKNIALEIACFDRDAVLKAQQALKLDTDAAKFFTHGVDPANVLRAKQLFEQLTGLKAEKTCYAGKLEVSQQSVNLPAALAAKICGDLWNMESFKEQIAKLGFNAIQKMDIIECMVPTWRHDIDCSQVLLSEYVRVLGYEKISSDARWHVANNQIADVANKMHELSAVFKRTYYEAKTFKLVKGEESMLLNPMPGYDMLRQSLLPELQVCAIRNYKAGREYCGLFEVGKVFGDGEEVERFGLVIMDYKPDTMLELLKKEAAYVLEVYGVDASKMMYEHVFDENGLFVAGYEAVITYKRAKIGKIGLCKHDLKSKVQFAGLELNLNAVQELKKKKTVQYVDYQEVYKRDFSFKLTGKTEAGELIDKLSKAFPEIEFYVFDVYPNNMLQDRTVSIRAHIRTMQTKTSEELNELCERISNTVQV